MSSATLARPHQSVKGTTVSHPPDELYLEVTNRCNLKCTTCPQFWGMSEASADLSPESVRAILDQLPSVRRVVLHGIGEPTLNPRLPAIIAEVKARGAYALFNTNGLTLRGRLQERIVASGLDEVRVSVDAATPETYRLVRGADGFSRIIENILGVARAKERAGSLTPRLSLWMTGLRTNILELPDLVRVAAGAGVNEVYLQRLVYSGRGKAREEEALFGRAAEAEKRAIREAQALADELGVTLHGSSEALPLGDVPGFEAAPWRACRRPWSLMYITANGNVLPCCISPFTDAPYESLVLGNVFHQPLEDVWNGQRYQHWRGRMLDGAPPAACASCGSGWAL